MPRRCRAIRALPPERGIRPNLREVAFAISPAHRGWTGAEPTDDAQMLRAVGGRVERRLADVGEEFAGLDQVGLTAFVAEGFARHGRVVNQLFLDPVG
ncbi:MAG: hypothetical protein HY076_03670, partial [Candidatus Eisenbacteria bacterium]|nr:hypothetical protein [Candidatus Eisenbacteria bacterium]